ncbi:MAG: hypothetical protein UT02_C0024G0004 [Parcubacteria group bacterium GW2011_GWC2_38_7]|nr:MAG: hypothetical protein UT02_C0024G0004 [Parcubacteria group bacterium GW2011_GWC2_38_7]
MAKNSKLEQLVPAISQPLEYESKESGRIDVPLAEIEQLVSEINVLMTEYSILPDSFLMPADYALPEKEFELKKKNKLMTAWFTKAFDQMGTAQEILGFNAAILAKLESDFRALLVEEGAQVKSRLADKKLDFSNSAAIVQLYKEIKRDLAPQYVEAKTQLINSIEFVLKRCLADLQKRYAS